MQCGHGFNAKEVEVPKKVIFFERKNVKDVVAGQFHTLALTEDNELYAWGKG